MELPHSPAPATASGRLPTLQRNALRKLLSRPEFSPAEVAELGYARIRKAEGIGPKGIATITAWLREHGFELAPPAASRGGRNASGRRSVRDIEAAKRILEAHGYVIRRNPEN